MHTIWIVAIIILIAIVVLCLNIVMRKKGYSIPGKTVVRCSKGHIFKTVWIEGGSLKALRLEPRTRYQHCPVGKHWAIVHPVKERDLTTEDRQALEEH